MNYSPASFFGRALSATKDFVLSRGGIVLLGLVLLVLLVWFGAPLFGWRGVGLRLTIIGVILGIAVIVFGVRWWLDRRRARRLEQELNESAMLGTRPDRQTEIESLRKQMQDAISALKSSHLGTGTTGAAALYALPWYMVIGPSGAGKSTILRNSSLDFPYAKHDPRGVQGVGGTRNCDWWFSDQAIFLDTAGRYTTEEDDRDEWYAFLDLLRKNRTAQPINGVVIAIAIADLLTADSDAVAAHAKVVRERIDELIERLGILFPVYIIFTKCDLIRGFVPFFSDLGDEERGQVWGANVPVDLSRKEVDHGDVFRDEFDGLHARLAAHRMGKLSLQRNVDTKLEILGFANQFMAARERLAEFVGQVFKKDPYRETPLFNGFYFTSGAQEGVPIERILGSAVQAFGEVNGGTGSAPPAAQRAYFIYHLLKDVVLPNRRQVVRNRRKEQRARNIKRAVIVAAILLMIGGGVLFSAAYTERMMLLARAAESSRDLVQNLESRGTASELPALTKATAAYYSGSGPLWAEDLREASIYTPRGVDEPLRQEFLSVMETLFLRPVGRHLERKLEDYLSGRLGRAVAVSAGGENASDMDRRSATAEAYDALKMYIYLGSPQVTDPTPLVDSFVDVWGDALEQAGVSRDVIEQRRMRVMVGNYLRAMRTPAEDPLHVRAWDGDRDLVERVRNGINQVSPAERIYLDLCEAGARKYEPVDLTTLLDNQPRGALVSKYRIPGIYTRKGWDDFAKDEIERLVTSGHGTEWVMGAAPADASGEMSTQAREQLIKQVRHMYFSDYSRHWFAMLASISAHRFETLQDASMELQSLSREDGPIGALMQGVRKNVEITASGTGGGVFGGELIEELRIPFKHLRRLTREAASGDKDAWLTRYLDSLAAIQKDIAKLASSSDVGRDTRQFAGKLLDGEGESELHRSWLTVNNVVEDMDARSAEVVANMLRAPMRNVWGTIIGVAQRDVERIWKGEVLYAYNEALADRFPFAPDGRDAEINDVADFFRSGSGTMSAFIEKDLRPFVEQHGRTWETRRWLGIGMEFSPEFLAVLEKSQLISSSMFRQSGSRTGMTFSVYPFASGALSESLLQVDGEDYRYRNGPQEWHPFPWPGQSPGARVRGVRTGSSHAAELSAEGPWAWLRLLSMAETRGNPDGSFTATWKMRDTSGQAMNVSFKVRADSHNNPFGQGAVQGLRLPSEIFRRAPTSSAALDGRTGRS